MKGFRETAAGEQASDTGNAAAAPGKRTLVEALLGGFDGAGKSEVIVTASSLRVRSSPDTSSKGNVIGKLHEGDRVTVAGAADSWLIAEYGGAEGYISGKYTRPASFIDDLGEWLEVFKGGGSDHDGDDDRGGTVDPAGPSVDPSNGPSVDPSEPTGPAGPDIPGPESPVTPAKPSGGAAKLADPVFAAYLAGLGKPEVDAAAQAVASCEQQSAALAGKLDRHEEQGAERDALVASIATARVHIAALDGAGLDAADLAYARSTLYGILHGCAPYYSQGRNINVLETQGDTRTCNLTSLAMVLEGLGKSANDYAGSRDKVLAVARYSAYAPRVNEAVRKQGGGSGDWGRLAALRLPDFLQLAAVADCLSGGTSEADVLAAAQSAWKRIVKEFQIHINIAKRFGVNGETRVLEGGLGSALGGIKKSARKEMQKVVDARNTAERTGDAGDQADYAALRGAHAAALDGAKIEDKVPLEDYRDTVITEIGGELASGAGVFMLMAGHYARVQSVAETHVVVDDPGQDHRSGQKVLWDEARAMGYFKKRLVFR